MKITNEYLKALVKEGLNVKMGKQELDEAPAFAPDIAGAPNQELTANMAAQAKAAPAPAPVAPAAKPQDRSGMTPEANAVTKSIQQALGIKADGLYGKNTQAAVNKFFADKKQPLPRGANFLDTIKKQLAAIQAAAPAAGAISAAPSTAATGAPPAGSKAAAIDEDTALELAGKLATNLDKMYVTDDQLKAALDDLKAFEKQYGPAGIKMISDSYYQVSGTGAKDGLTSLANEIDDIDDWMGGPAAQYKNQARIILQRAGAWNASGAAPAAAPAPALPAGPQGAKQVAENKLRVSKAYLQQVIKEELQNMLNEQNADPTAAMASGLDNMILNDPKTAFYAAKGWQKDNEPMTPELFAAATKAGYVPTPAYAEVLKAAGIGATAAPAATPATPAVPTPTDPELGDPTKPVSQAGIIPDPDAPNKQVMNFPPATLVAKKPTAAGATKPNPTVVELQKMLIAAGLPVGSGKANKPDGIYGKVTKQAVQNFFLSNNTQVPSTIKGQLETMRVMTTPNTQITAPKSVAPKGKVGGAEVGGQSLPVSSEVTSENKIRFTKSYVDQVIKEETAKVLKKKIYKNK